MRFCQKMMASPGPALAAAAEIPDARCDSVCSICETGGADDDGLLLCDGFCLRAFHAECLGDGSSAQGASGTGRGSGSDMYWACFDCTHGLQRCFVCKQYERSKRMVKCTHGGGECGKWFHVACAPGKQLGVAYECPQHVCHACGSPDVKSKCLKCAKAYCQKCRPAAVHLLDDRKYFTCVEHLQGMTLPPIPIRFMEKLVTTRMKTRTRCPSKHRKALEKEREFVKSLPKGRKSGDIGDSDGDDVDDADDERLMSMDQLISLREERALEFLRGQKVRMDSKQQQQSDLLKSVSIAVTSSSSTTSSSSSSKNSSSSRKRKDDDALEKLKAAMNRQNRPRKRARTGGHAGGNANLMPTASYVSLFQGRNGHDHAVFVPVPLVPSTSGHGQFGASSADNAPFGASAADSAPFGAGAANNAADSAPFGSGSSSSSSSSSSTAAPAVGGGHPSSRKRTFDAVAPTSPVLPLAPATPQQTMADIRAGVLRMVASMLAEQRAKVVALQAATCVP